MKIPINQYWNLLRQYLKPQRPWVILLSVLLLAHIILQLFNPLVMRFFIDTAVAGGDLSPLIMAALLYLVIALINQGLGVSNTYLGEQVAWTATNALRLDLLSHVLHLDQSFHKKHPTGELLERIDGDVNALSNFFSRFVVHLLGNALLLLGVLFMLYRIDIRLGLALTLFTGIGLIIMIKVRTMAVPYWSQLRQISAEFFGFLGEQLAGREDIRANGTVAYVLHNFDGFMQRWYPIRHAANVRGSLLWTTNIALFALAYVVSLSISGALWSLGQMSIGTVFLVFYYTEMLRTPMTQLRTQLEDLQKAEAGINRITRLFQTHSALMDDGRHTLPSGPLPVEFNQVSFSYDGSEIVIDDLSFVLAPGRVLGLLGRTGSGKTTTARLLLRLVEPQSGTISLNGTSLPEVPLKHLRHRISLVTQDVQLFQASIRDNLTFFNPDIADEAITAVLHNLGLAEWLAAQPAGLDTIIASGGADLSAGQAQLVAFARVFLTDPGLVILDEASSRLDPATERLIEQALDTLLADRTGIIIAHRLNTVQRADDILILENGRVLEYGSRLALAADPDSHFSKLLQTGLEEVLA